MAREESERQRELERARAQARRELERVEREQSRAEARRQAMETVPGTYFELQGGPPDRPSPPPQPDGR